VDPPTNTTAQVPDDYSTVRIDSVTVTAVIGFTVVVILTVILVCQRRRIARPSTPPIQLQGARASTPPTPARPSAGAARPARPSIPRQVCFIPLADVCGVCR